MFVVLVQIERANRSADLFRNSSGSRKLRRIILPYKASDTMIFLKLFRCTCNFIIEY
jgi:hypothetical protein